MRITALWSRDATVVFDFELDSGMVAFVDREWSLRGESVPALLVGREEVAWWDGSAVGDHQALPATIALDAQQVASGIIAAIAVHGCRRRGRGGPRRRRCHRVRRGRIQHWRVHR